jgi:hypothetical protein
MKCGTFVPGGLLILSFFLASTPIVWCTQASAPGMVTIEISPQPSRLTLHEPVVLTLEITNNRRDPIHIDLGRDRKENFKISITPPTGDTVQLPQLVKRGFSRVGDVEIGAGNKYSQSLVLNEWYNFNNPGLYEIKVELATPALANGVIVGGQEAFNTRIEIEPRNQEALVTRCEDLVAGIEASTSYERSAERALALSYINDPVAVPYLERALRANKLVEPIAIKGLESISTPEAVRALSSALKMNVNHASALARSALSRMESETGDPEVKQEIHRVIREASNPTS